MAELKGRMEAYTDAASSARIRDAVFRKNLVVLARISLKSAHQRLNWIN